MEQVNSFKIHGRLRAENSIVATDVNNDFILGDSVPVGPEILINDPTVTLWSLDIQNKKAVFVQTPTVLDLSNVAFSYLTQFLEAERILTCSFDTFNNLSELCAKVPNNFSILYSTGRCGSTLVHNLINKSSVNIASVSEPDPFFVITLALINQQINIDIAIKLLKSSARFLVHNLPPEKDSLIIKTRGKTIWIFDALLKAFPNHLPLFMFRNVIDTVQSYDRISSYYHGKRQRVLRIPMAKKILAEYILKKTINEKYIADLYQRTLTSGTIKEFIGEIGWCGQHALDWVSKVEYYFQLTEVESATMNIRYEDLVNKPMESISNIFEYLDIPITEINEVMAVLSRDSQKGTSLARVKTLKYPLDFRTCSAITETVQSQTRIPINFIE